MHENAAYHYFEDVNWGLLRLWGGRTGLRVLDVGCGFATTSARIQQLGNEVTGIDSSPEIEAVAATRIARVIHGDVVDVELGGEQFDVIIFADVLEHLPWPVGVLRRYLRWLAPGGSVIISLPNVGLWSVRLGHLLGRWEYDETGVLDRTHLRFFTRRSARWMIGEAGLRIVRTTYNPGLVRPLVPLAKKLLLPRHPERSEGPGRAARQADASSPARPGPSLDARDDRPAPDALLNSKPYQLYLKTVHPLERAVASLWPGMLAFQMIFEARQ